MFGLTPEEKKELLRLMQIAYDCGQLYVYDNVHEEFARAVRVREDFEGDIIVEFKEML